MDSFEQVLPKLVNIQLFSDFNPELETDREILRAVYDNLLVKKYRAGQTLITEGETGDLFFILYSGEVLITRKTSAGDVIALATLSSEQNIFFGEMTLITNDQRSATVTAKTDCVTLAVSGKKFHELCDRYPVLGYRVLSVLSRRLADTVSEMNKDKAILYEALCNEIEIGV